MAEKIINTRIINKNAEFNQWMGLGEYEAAGASTLALKKGEIALARFNAATTDPLSGEIKHVPAYAIKVGTGEEGKETFKDAAWLYAPASDVHEWAKKDALAYDDLPETLRNEIDVLQEAVGGEGSVADMIAAAIAELDVAESKDTDETNGGVVISAISETDGKISVTRRALTADDIPELAQSKITGLETALSNINTKFTDYRTSAAQDEIDADQNAAIVEATAAGTSAQAYAESIYKAGEGEAAATGVLAEYIVSNDAAVAEVKATADAAAVKADVDVALENITKEGGLIATAKREAISAAKIETETQISTFKTTVVDPIDGRLTTAEQQISALSSATHFLGVKSELPSTATKGDIVIVGNKEYVYDPEATVVVEGTHWVELGDTTAELEAIDQLDGRLESVETSLAEGGKTAKAIEAAKQAGIDAAGVVDGKLTAYSETHASDYTNTQIDEAVAGAKKAGEDAAAAVDAKLADYAKSADVTEEIGEAVAPKLDTATYEAYIAGKEMSDAALKEYADTQASAAKAAAEAAAGALDAYKGTTDAAIKTINDNYVRVSGSNLVFGQGEEELTIIFDCGGIA